MIDNERQEEEEKEETSTVVTRNIRSKRRIENIQKDNILDFLDKIEAKMINNDDTFSEGVGVSTILSHATCSRGHNL